MRDTKNICNGILVYMTLITIVTLTLNIVDMIIAIAQISIYVDLLSTVMIYATAIILVVINRQKLPQLKSGHIALLIGVIVFNNTLFQVFSYHTLTSDGWETYYIQTIVQKFRYVFLYSLLILSYLQMKSKKNVSTSDTWYGILIMTIVIILIYIAVEITKLTTMLLTLDFVLLLIMIFALSTTILGSIGRTIKKQAKISVLIIPTLIILHLAFMIINALVPEFHSSLSTTYYINSYTINYLWGIQYVVFAVAILFCFSAKAMSEKSEQRRWILSAILIGTAFYTIMTMASQLSYSNAQYYKLLYEVEKNEREHFPSFIWRKSVLDISYGHQEITTLSYSDSGTRATKNAYRTIQLQGKIAEYDSSDMNLNFTSENKSIPDVICCSTSRNQTCQIQTVHDIAIGIS